MLLDVLIWFFMYVYALPVCVYGHYICVWSLQRSQEGIGGPGTRVTNGCEIPCGCWKLDLGPSQEQQVLSRKIKFMLFARKMDGQKTS